ncbi:MAG: type II secretion system protein [Coraliomargarita sp.]
MARPHQSSHRSRQINPLGFTLVEIMIVVVLIGLLSAMAIPAFKKVRESSLSSRLMNDYRIFSGAFAQFELENGYYPPDGGFIDLPPLMIGYLPNDSWRNPPAQGQWMWDFEDRGIRAGISYRDSTLNDEFFVKVDAKLDDGDLATGLFQKLTDDRYSYILEP